MGRGKDFNAKRKNQENQKPKQATPLQVEPVASQGDRPKYTEKGE